MDTLPALLKDLPACVLGRAVGRRPLPRRSAPRRAGARRRRQPVRLRGAGLLRLPIRDLRSAELWRDTEDDRSSLEPRPLDLVLFHDRRAGLRRARRRRLQRHRGGAPVPRGRHGRQCGRSRSSPRRPATPTCRAQACRSSSALGATGCWSASRSRVASNTQRRLVAVLLARSVAPLHAEPAGPAHLHATRRGRRPRAGPASSGWSADDGRSAATAPARHREDRPSRGRPRPRVRPGDRSLPAGPGLAVARRSPEPPGGARRRGRRRWSAARRGTWSALEAPS